MNPENAACVGLVAGLIFMGIFGFVGYAIGRPKGLGGLGFVLGALLGIIGLIIVALMGGSAPAYRVRSRRPMRPMRAATSGPAAPVGRRRLRPRPR